MVNLNDILAQSISLASMLHDEQRDMHGQPYILHPLRVMFAVRHAGFAVPYQIVAVLHDVIEDTDFGVEQLRLIIGTPLTEAVLSVTRTVEPEKEVYRNFITRACEHPIGRVVKFFDIMDNSDPSRMHPKAPIERYRRAVKWITAIDPTLKKYDLYFGEK